MSAVFSICRWEWFKLLRRVMPWILLGILFLFSQLSVWGGLASYASDVASGTRIVMRNTGPTPGMPRLIACKQIESNPAEVLPPGAPPQAITALQLQCQARQAQLPASHQALAPAGSVKSTLGIAAGLGVILLGILGASVVGMEYGAGTLRPILSRGTGRLPYLAGKYLMLVAATTAALLLVCAAAAASGALAFSIAPLPPPGPVPDPVSWSSIGVTFLKAWGALIAFMTMAGAVTLLLRSTALGMAISLGWYIAEVIVIRLLSRAFDWINQVADYLPMRNLNALNDTRGNLPAAFTQGMQGNDIGTLHAGLVVAAWAIGLAIIAALVFRRRDIVGAAAS